MRKMKDFGGSVGLSPSANIQKMDLKLTPVSRRKTLNFLMKMKEFRGSVGLSPSAKSQKMDLTLTPACGAKNVEFR